MMNQFTYLARDRAGTLTRGTHAAETPQRLQSALEATGLSLVSFSTGETSSAGGIGSGSPHFQVALWWRPSGRAVELALKQMAMMLRSGLDLRSTLQTVLDQSTSLPLAAALRTIIRSIDQLHQRFVVAIVTHHAMEASREQATFLLLSFRFAYVIASSL